MLSVEATRKTGHYMSVCRSCNKKILVLNKVSNLNLASLSDNLAKTKVEEMVNDFKVKTLSDTGSSHSYINLSIIQKLKHIVIVMIF